MTLSSPSLTMTALKCQSLFPVKRKSQQKEQPNYTSNMCSTGSDYRHASLVIGTPDSMLSSPRSYVDYWVSHKISQQPITLEWMDNQKPPINGWNNTFASTLTITRRTGSCIFLLWNSYTTIGQMKLQGSLLSCSSWDITRMLIG